MLNTSTSQPEISSQAGFKDEMTIDNIRRDLAISDMRERFHRMAQQLVEAVDADTSVLVPRPSEGSQATISEWFSAYHDRFVSIMVELFRKEISGLFPDREGDMRQFLAENLWPLAEAALHAYILHRLAVRWAARQYTDLTIVMSPERESYGWRLPLRIKGRETDMGQIALDTEGNIIKNRTTSRESFREVLLSAA